MRSERYFLRMRNRYFPDGETEVFGNFKKSGNAYFTNAFFGKFFLRCLIFTAFGGLLLLSSYLFFRNKDDIEEFYIVLGAMTALGPFCWLTNAIIDIWKWKYTKHVIVTNEGVWIAYCGHPFWGGKSFDGKRHFFSVKWSLYSWDELGGLFIEESRISRLYNLKDLVMDRWDGEEIVRYLNARDAEMITEYGLEKLSPKKRNKKRRETKRSWWERLFLD